MHRQRTNLVPRTERLANKIGRGDPLVRTAKKVQFRGIITTYKIHDRQLGNRTGRRRYHEDPPALDDVPRRRLADLDERGYAIVPFADPCGTEGRAAVEGDGGGFGGGGGGSEGADTTKAYLIRRYAAG